MNFLGHVCRLPDVHIVTDAVRWRNLAWWKDFQQRHPTRMGGQPGRRGADYGNPCRAELHTSRKFEAYRRIPHGAAVIRTLSEHRLVRQWSDLALFRRECKDFSKWAAFSGNGETDIDGNEDLAR